MLRFKQFVDKIPNQQKDVIPSRILVQDYDELKKRFIEREKKDIKESNRESMYGEYDTKPLEDWLHKRYSDFTPEEHENINNYSNNSFHLNGHLLASHHLGLQPKLNPQFKKIGRRYDLGVMDNLLTRKPIGRSLTVHSGVGFDPRIQMSKSGHIHLPSYTSTSISPKAAISFASEGKADEDKHMLRIQLQPHDTGAYIGTPSGYIHEREFVLPRNTTLRIHKSERSKENPSVWIHHAVVDNNIEPENIERNPKIIQGLHENFHKAFGSESANSDIAKKMDGHYAKILQDDNLKNEDLQKILQSSKNTKILSSASSHKNINKYDLQNIFGGYNTNIPMSIIPEIHKKIVDNKDSTAETLYQTALSSSDPEIHKKIIDHENVDNRAIGTLIRKTNDGNIINSIGNVLHKHNLDTFDLSNIAKKTKNPEIHKKILNHKNSDGFVMSTIASHSDDPEIHKHILTHPNLNISSTNTIMDKYVPQNLSFKDKLNIDQDRLKKTHRVIDELIKNQQSNPYHIESFLSAYKRVIIK